MISTAVVPVAISAVTIVPLAPELSVIVTLRFEKSIPLSFII